MADRTVLDWMQPSPRLASSARPTLQRPWPQTGVVEEELPQTVEMLLLARRRVHQGVVVEVAGSLAKEETVGQTTQGVCPFCRGALEGM